MFTGRTHNTYILNIMSLILRRSSAPPNRENVNGFKELSRDETFTCSRIYIKNIIYIIYNFNYFLRKSFEIYSSSLSPVNAPTFICHCIYRVINISFYKITLKTYVLILYSLFLSRVFVFSVTNDDIHIKLCFISNILYNVQRHSVHVVIFAKSNYFIYELKVS